MFSLPNHSHQEKSGTKPVFYHSLPGILADEMVHSYDLLSVIDLTASDGSWALACIRAKRPYVGVCFTEFHVKALRERLQHLVLLAMKDETDSLYQPSFADALNGKINEKNPKKRKSDEEKKRGGAKKGRKGGEGGKSGGENTKAELLKKLKGLAKGGKAKSDPDDDEEDDGDEGDESEELDSHD